MLDHRRPKFRDLAHIEAPNPCRLWSLSHFARAVSVSATAAKATLLTRLISPPCYPRFMTRFRAAVNSIRLVVRVIRSIRARRTCKVSRTNL